MSAYVAGTGWVTPLGTGVPEVWDRLLRGDEAKPEPICDPIGKKVYIAFRIPGEALTNLPSHPRLRRASAISRFAAAAGLLALADAKLPVDADTAKRIALVFAIANGGVIYTKRFYHDVVASGADAASPLLFPETVFNAAASHLAALIGVTGTSYTVVGDGAVGLLAMKMAEDLLADQDIDYCLVVGAEEADWLLCDACQKWRLLRSTPPIEPFNKPAKGTILSEGAGAVLLARSGTVKLDQAHSGHYSKRKKAPGALTAVVQEMALPEQAVVIGSANGTFVDEVEADVISRVLPGAPVYAPKGALGEGVAAAGLWQVIVATQVLRTRKLPRAHLNRPADEQHPRLDLTGCGDAIVTSCGMNQQVAALRLSI